MGRFDGIDTAGRQIAGLLTYNPGPGIYSRLERAIEDMPANVRVQELPGLLKRYKEGVPGWELKATDLDSTIAGRDVVPRDELLAAVRERSPVHTHREMLKRTTQGEYAQDASAIGRASTPYSAPDYELYGHGGKDYSELLLLQPDAAAGGFDSPHFSGALAQNAVAHARYDTHGDALRINELQSDLGIHNRKAREAGPMPDYAGGDGPFDFMPPQDEAGMAAMAQERKALPFPLEDAWADLLIKRLALEAARKGHRAIEVASPRAIADKVGGNIDNYEHFYGKVVPGALERLGRKMGGLVDDTGPSMQAVRRQLDNPAAEGREELKDIARSVQGDDFIGSRAWRLYNELTQANLSPADRHRVYDFFGGYGISSRPEGQIASDMYEHFVGLGYTPQQAQTITSRALFEAPRAAALQNNYATLRELQSLEDGVLKGGSRAAGRRYIMSDEMRRRLIEQGVGASVLAPLLMQGEE